MVVSMPTGLGDPDGGSNTTFEGLGAIPFTSLGLSFPICNLGKLVLASWVFLYQHLKTLRPLS